MRSNSLPPPHTMISAELLKILCCPETKKSLALANASELETLNHRVEKKELVSVEGKTLSEPLSAVLLRDDGKVAYRIQNDIPILLIQEGIKL